MILYHIICYIILTTIALYIMLCYVMLYDIIRVTITASARTRPSPATTGPAGRRGPPASCSLGLITIITPITTILVMKLYLVKLDHLS